MKKHISILALSFILFLVGSETINGRKLGTEEYWKTIMSGQPIPESIKQLLAQGPSSTTTTEATRDNGGGQWFNRDFDTTPNAIIYHPHHQDHDSGVQWFKRDFDTTPNAIIYHPRNDHDNGGQWFKKDFDTTPNAIIYHPRQDPTLGKHDKRNN